MKKIRKDEGKGQRDASEIKGIPPKTEGIAKEAAERIRILRGGQRNSITSQQVSAMMGLIEDGGSEALIEAIEGCGYLVKSQAIWRLSEAGDPAAAGLFKRIFGKRGDSFETESRRHALAGLAKMDDPKIFDILAIALEDGEWLVRVDACRLLGAKAGDDAVGLLAKLADDDNQSVRIVLAETLGKIATRRGDEVLSRLLEDADPWVRAWGAKALGARGGPEARQALERVIESDASSSLRLFALRALDGI